MAPLLVLPLLIAIPTLLLISAQYAAAGRISLPPRRSFSPDLSFPAPASSSSSSSSLNSYTQIAPFSLFVSVANSSSFDAGAKGFSVGFLSLFDSSASSPTRIYFCVCLGVTKSGPSSRPFLVPVWSWNDSSPLRQQQGPFGFVKLEVDDHKELLLQDGDGRVVWRVSNVESMEMQDNGNLIIYNSTNQTVWQSFDHPSDSLLKGQQFRLGMELTSRNHMYKAVMEPGGLSFFLVSANPSLPLVYAILTPNTTINNYFKDWVAAFDLNVSAPINVTSSMLSPSCAQYSNASYALLDGNVLKVFSVCGDQFVSIDIAPADLIRLDADGNLRDYYLHNLTNSSYAFTSGLEDNKPCTIPNVCGAYGVCTVSSLYGTHIQHFCRCPSEDDNKNLSNAFRFIDASDPSQGCERTETLDCKPNSNEALVEIKNVASIVMLYLFEVTWRENSIPLEDCKASCSSNCSCSGFLYHTKSSFCFPFGDDTGISNLSLISISSDHHVAYLKIQLQSSSSHGNKYLPFQVVAAVLLALILTAASVVIYRKWKQKRDPELRLAEEQLLGVMPTLPTRFSYQELSRFTNRFSTPLGAGGFGFVYAGVLPDGRSVAVKRLQHLSHGQKEFLAEIATIGGISHVNIVHLYGFCLEKQHRLLVYEYMENGSLDKWLFWKEGEQQLQVMSWEKRFNVALGTARGLAFLHEECPKPILHFDVKPQNILLDKDFNAKLADFGLSKQVANGHSSAVTVVRGTPGYIAPEWVCHSIVSKKCDVYSFGMVLLELVSGRKNVEMELKGSDEWYFPKWAAKKSREGKVDELVDKRLVKTLKSDDELSMGVVIDESMLEQVKRVVGVALMCINEKPEMRPSMMGACSMLEGSTALPNHISLVDTTGFVEIMTTLELLKCDKVPRTIWVGTKMPLSVGGEGQVPMWQILSVMSLEMVAICLSVTPALGVILSPK